MLCAAVGVALLQVACLRHVLLDGAARRAIVIEACHAAIDLEGGDVEQAPLQRIGLFKVASADMSEEAASQASSTMHADDISAHAWAWV